MKILFTAILSIVLSVAAQYSLKAGMSGQGVKEILAQPFAIRHMLYVLTDMYVLVGFVLYGLGAVIWLVVLSEWDVSKAYPLVGLGFILTVVVGGLVGEQVSALRALGVIMISAGVWMVASS